MSLVVRIFLELEIYLCISFSFLFSPLESLVFGMTRFLRVCIYGRSGWGFLFLPCSGQYL